MDRDRIASLVLSRRNKVGISQEDLAEAIGKTKGLIGHIENARYGSSTDTLVAVAAALQARWEIRLVGAGEGAARDEKRQQILDLVDSIVDRLKDRDAEYLLGIVRLYADGLDREAAERAAAGVQGQSSR